MKLRLKMIFFTILILTGSFIVGREANAGSLANWQVEATYLQPDGKIIAVGHFTNFNGETMNRIVRLFPDGTIDHTFNTGTGFNGDVGNLLIQSDGKLIVGGSFSSYNGVTRNRLVRLETDGTLDTTLNTGTGPVSVSGIVDTAIQSDGKIMVVDNFTSFGGYSRNRVARLNTNGSVDTTFNPGSGANNAVMTVSLQSDDKAIIGGWFTTYNGSSRNRVVRLNVNGTLDTTFVIGTGANGVVFASAIQPDGKILIGGDFTSYNGIARNRIARLNTDGSLDTTFDPGAGFSSSVLDIMVQSDGKIMVGGTYFNINGYQQDQIARLNSDGSVDISFDSSNGASMGGIHTIVQRPDGKYVIGGSFETYAGVSRNNIAVINADGSLDTTFDGGPVSLATVTTDALDGIEPREAVGHATVNTTGGDIVSRYIDWGTESGVYTSSCSAGSGIIGAYSCVLTNLSPDTTYYVRARVVNAAGASYGLEEVFTTPSVLPPSGYVDSVSDITPFSADVNAWVNDDGGEDVDVEIVWGQYESEFILGEIMGSCDAGTGSAGSFGCRIMGLAEGTRYYVRVNVTNTAGSVLSEEVDFTTTLSDPSNLDTRDVTDIEARSATGNVEILNGSYDSVGVTWGRESGNYEDSCNAGDGVSEGVYSCDMTNLEQDTIYYVRSWAYHSEIGSVYGDEIVFQTIEGLTVETLPATDITMTTATLEGDVLNDGGETSIGRWFEIGTSSGDYEMGIYDAGTGGEGVFTYNIADLTPGTTYYYRAVVSGEGSGGTELSFLFNLFVNTAYAYYEIYGEEMSFTTPDPPAPVTTNLVTEITETTATGNVTITENFQWVLVEWGTESGSYPYSCNTGGTIAGAYACDMTDLSPNTTYYVVAHAYNEESGDIYGDEIIFTTLDSSFTATPDSQSLTATIAENMTLTCGSDIDIDNGTTLIPGTPRTNTTTCSVTTNDSSGYDLQLTNDRGTNNTLYHTTQSTNPNGQIPDKPRWDPNTPNAQTFTDTGLAFGILSSTATKNDSWWGTATTCTDTDQLYAGIPDTTTDIMRHETYSNTHTDTTICYQVNVPSTQIAGEYTGSVTYTATGRP